MMAPTDRPNRLTAAVARLSAREQKLLALMLPIVATALFAIVGAAVWGSLTSRHESVTAKRAALDALIARRATFVADAAEAARVREQLADNDVRLSTFIEGRAGRASIPRPREFRDSSQPLEGGATAHLTTAEFSSITFAQMQQLLSSIAGAEELVFIRSLSFAPERRAATNLKLDLTLATYTREDGE